MKIIHTLKQTTSTLGMMGTSLLFTGQVLATGNGGVDPGNTDPNVVVDEDALGFAIPNFSDLLTFIIRFVFVVAGVVALIMLLWGALSWVTSGGDKANVEAARGKIVNAIIGVLLIIVVIAIVATLEQVVFANRMCFGLTCGVTIPQILSAPGT